MNELWMAHPHTSRPPFVINQNAGICLNIMVDVFILTLILVVVLR